MQRGYEPRGSRGPGRGVYLVRRAVLIAALIVLVAFVLPRACGTFLDTDSASDTQQQDQQAQTASGGQGTDDNAGSSGTSGSGEAAEGSSTSEGAADEFAAGADDPQRSAEGPTEVSEAADEPEGGEDAMPATVEETLAVEEPAPEAPTGVPTRGLAAERAKEAQQGRVALQSRLAPPMTPLRALPLLPEPEPVRRRASKGPAPDGGTQVQVASEPVAVERTAASQAGQGGMSRSATQVVVTQSTTQVEVAQPAVETSAAPAATPATTPAAVAAPAVEATVASVAEVSAGGGRVARAGDNVAYATAGGAEDGGSAARTVANAQQSLEEITPSGGGARAAVRGALNDAEAAVGAAEALADEPAGGRGQRCKKNPERCVSDLIR